MEWETVSASESETLARAAEVAAALKPGDAVALGGPLGAGKTLFCRGIARALGYTGPVSSPSYALVHEYAGPVPIYHMDLYRLTAGVDWTEIGIEHYFGGAGICLVEWPDHLPSGGHHFGWRVTLTPRGETRRHLHVWANREIKNPVFVGWNPGSSDPRVPTTPETYRP